MRCSLWIETRGSKGDERLKWVRGALHWNARDVGLYSLMHNNLIGLTRFAFEEQFIGIETGNDTFQVRQVYLHGLYVEVSPVYIFGPRHTHIQYCKGACSRLVIGNALQCQVQLCPCCGCVGKNCGVGGRGIVKDGRECDEGCGWKGVQVRGHREV